MGEQKVVSISDQLLRRHFTRRLLTDLQALDYLLEHEAFERGVTRIGAEQELFLIDARTLKPVPLAMEVLQKLADNPAVVTELARFNLEINLQPRVFAQGCLRDMEQEIETQLQAVREALSPLEATLILTGILPTIRKHDLELHNLTPLERYRLLIDAIHAELTGQAFELRLHGIDELLVKHDSPLLEACNTSFQVHLQVAPRDFAPMYNIAQALSGPVLAIAANSPIVFGRRLWHETRIALFQQSVDVRTTHAHLRERSPRVSFGAGWLEHSILEIYREDIARFRPLICADIAEDALQEIDAGRIPGLKALRVHNSTVYRWNRPCYGISPNGAPHLRIENRVLPAGPSVPDQMANAALWLGAVTGFYEAYPDVRQKMSWEDVRDNFEKAARFGIDTKFTWFNDQKISACDLILHELLPLARAGLQKQSVHAGDMDTYLGIIEERARHHRNGARWQLRAYTKLKKESNADEALRVMTASMLQNQIQGKPVHTWDMPELTDLDNYQPAGLRVEAFMQTDFLTVQQDDLIELAAQLMDWKRIRYLPVEDAKGHLCGLVTSRLALRHFMKLGAPDERKMTTVEDIMIADPISIQPQTTILEAMRLMQEKQIGCLPVVENDELIGMITEVDFLQITARLMERLG
ncbi:MAG: Glutamate--cysteine ligase [Haliscomenobacter sp.]|jgi:predicted transcriptional regulator/gamma-glutamylcysteine synthetase|nr:Glutamate--cysteine ligase [Haliscomenobacter sp.]